MLTVMNPAAAATGMCKLLLTGRVTALLGGGISTGCSFPAASWRGGKSSHRTVLLL